jgi:hypothetical protein
MDEDYELMKEALIALLCVGDRIYRVYGSSVGLSRAAVPTIALATVTEIISKTEIVVKRSYTGPGSVENVRSIDVYEGQLYVWNVGTHLYDLPQKERLEKLAEIVKMESTQHVNFD